MYTSLVFRTAVGDETTVTRDNDRRDDNTDADETEVAEVR